MESWELPISYKQIKFSGARDLNILDTRSSPIPQKIRNFLWLFHQDKIQPVDQLIEKEWKGSEWCKLCGVAASADHIMFTCPIAWYVWWMISDMLQWQSCPMHLSDFTIKFSDQGGSKKKITKKKELWSWWVVFSGHIGSPEMSWCAKTKLFPLLTFVFTGSYCLCRDGGLHRSMKTNAK